MPTVHAAPLPKPQRTQLENTVKSAREVAEKGARAALAQLAVGEARAPDYLSDDHKALRRRLMPTAARWAMPKPMTTPKPCSNWCGKWPTSTGTACCLPAFWPKTACCCGR